MADQEKKQKAELSLVEAQALNFILEHGVKGFKADWFTTGREQFDYILAFYQRYGKIPDKLTFVSKFKTFKVFAVNDPFTSLVERLKEEARYKKVIPAYNKAYDLMTEGKSDEACKLLVDSITKIERELTTGLPPVDISDPAVKKSLYAELKRETTRYSTGRPELDKAFGGWNSKDYVVIFARLGIGKQQPNSCEVLTLTGSIKMGDIKVGDEILGVDGSVQKVLKVFPQTDRRVYQVNFNDGSSTKCGPDHLWTYYRYNRHKGLVQETKTLQEMIDYGLFNKKKNKCWLPQISPVGYSHKNFKCDPYVLGAFLGDGCLSQKQRDVSGKLKEKSLMLSSSESFIPEEVAIRIGDCTPIKSKTNFNWKFYKSPNHPLTVSEVLPEEFLGLNSYSKYIPEEYFYGDPEQRLDLLRGLLDTDGSFSYNSKNRHKVHYTSVSLKLAEGVIRLARSLGMVASLSTYHRIKVYKGVSKVKVGYRVSIKSKDLNPFLLPRKADQWTPSTKWLSRRFISVEQVEDEDSTCILVSNPDHLYLTNDFIPTHNTWIAQYFTYNLLKQGQRVGYYSGEMSAVEVSLRLDTFNTNISNRDLYNGKMSEKEYGDIANSFSDLPGKLFILTPEELGDGATIDDLKRFIEAQNLDALVIDQISLMKRNPRLSSPEAISELANNLRILQSITRIPFFIVSQQNRSSLQDKDSKSNEDLAASISYSDALGQNATIAFNLDYNSDTHILALKMVKCRRAHTQKFSYNWDIDKGLLRYVPMVDDDDGDEGGGDSSPDIQGGVTYGDEGDVPF